MPKSLLNLTSLRTLTVAAPTQPGRPAYFSAASGLVHMGNKLYVVADDEDYLGIFTADANQHGTLKQLFSDKLPLDKEQRKAQKSDLEVLTFIPANSRYAHGALLALGSGSTDNRKRAVMIAYDENNELVSQVETLNLSATYNQIDQRVPDLNIEGAVIAGEDIVLFQRGNTVSYNAMIRCRADSFLYGTDVDIRPLNFLLRRYDLGEIDGVPLGFTDAAALENGTIVFCAAAEDTSDAYNDGVCTGSVVGIINRKGELSKMVTVDKRVKLEGISATHVNNDIHLLMVTDADNIEIPAQVYSAILTT